MFEKDIFGICNNREYTIVPIGSMTVIAYPVTATHNQLVPIRTIALHITTSIPLGSWGFLIESLWILNRCMCGYRGERRVINLSRNWNLNRNCL